MCCLPEYQKLFRFSYINCQRPGKTFEDGLTESGVLPLLYLHCIEQELQLTVVRSESRCGRHLQYGRQLIDVKKCWATTLSHSALLVNYLF